MNFRRAFISYVFFQTILAVGAMSLSTHASAENTSLRPWLFEGAQCAYTVEYPKMPALPPVSDRNAKTVTQSGPGYQLSAACIAAPAPGSGPTLEGAALLDHLTGVSTSLGIQSATITVPTAPSPNCGLISGDIKNTDGLRRIRTKFCYGVNGYLIVETTSDRSEFAEQVALAFLQSVKFTNR